MFAVSAHTIEWNWNDSVNWPLFYLLLLLLFYYHFTSIPSFSILYILILSFSVCLCMCRVEMFCLERSDNKIRFEKLCSEQYKIHLYVIPISMSAVGCTHRKSVRCTPYRTFVKREIRVFHCLIFAKDWLCSNWFLFDFKCHFV